MAIPAHCFCAPCLPAGNRPCFPGPCKPPLCACLGQKNSSAMCWGKVQGLQCAAGQQHYPHWSAQHGHAIKAGSHLLQLHAPEPELRCGRQACIPHGSRALSAERNHIRCEPHPASFLARLVAATGPCKLQSCSTRAQGVLALKASPAALCQHLVCRCRGPALFTSGSMTILAREQPSVPVQRPCSGCFCQPTHVCTSLHIQCRLEPSIDCTA